MVINFNRVEVGGPMDIPTGLHLIRTYIHERTGMDVGSIDRPSTDSQWDKFLRALNTARLYYGV